MGFSNCRVSVKQSLKKQDIYERINIDWFHDFFLIGSSLNKYKPQKTSDSFQIWKRKTFRHTHGYVPIAKNK